MPTNNISFISEQMHGNRENNKCVLKHKPLIKNNIYRLERIRFRQNTIWGFCRVISTIFLISLICLHGNSQTCDTINFNIQEIIRYTISNSGYLKVAQNKYKSELLSYEIYELGNSFKLNLEGIVPDLNRSVGVTLTPQGEYLFIQQSSMISQVAITGSKNITKTGGKIGFSSNLQRLDLFSNGLFSSSTSYSAQPIALSYSQPLFGFNELRYSRELQKLKYQESLVKLTEEEQNIVYDAIKLFLDITSINEQLLSISENLKLLYQISSLNDSRLKVGATSQLDQLQLKYDIASFKSEEEEMTINLNSLMDELRNFLTIPNNHCLTFETPKSSEFDLANIESILSNIINNGTLEQLQEIKKYELQQEIKRQEQKGFTAEINGSIGLSGFSNSFLQTYSSIQDQERLNIKFSLPITGHKESRLNVEKAKLEFEINEAQNNLEKSELIRDIKESYEQLKLDKFQLDMLVNQQNNLNLQLDITLKLFKRGQKQISDLHFIYSELHKIQSDKMKITSNYWRRVYYFEKLMLNITKEEVNE